MAEKIINTVCSKDCYGACSMKVHIQDGVVIKTTGNPNNPATRGKLCGKGLHYPKDILYHKDRILYPLKRAGDGEDRRFIRISWDEAFKILFDKLTFYKEAYGPESVAFYQGSGNSGVFNQYAYGFWNQYGTITTTYGDLCDPAGGLAVKYTYGENKQNDLTDLLHSKLIVLWGANPAVTNIHCMYYINKAVKNGAKLISIDPRKSESMKNSGFHIEPRNGTDGLLALGLAKLLVKRKIIDINFINAYTFGFDEFQALLETLDIQTISDICEVPVDEINRFADYISENPAYALICGTGLQRYSNGGQTVRAIALLPALTGSIGKPGCGFYYSNKQAPNLKWPFLPPEPSETRQSINIVHFGEGLTAQREHLIKMLWIEKANPLVSNPNSGAIADSFKKLDFIVVSELFLTDTAKMADLILPATTFLEQNDIVCSYGHPYIQLKQKAVDPVGECKEEKAVYRKLGEMFEFDLYFLPDKDDEILEAVISYNHLDTTLEKLKEVPYLHKPCQEIAYQNLKFNTPTSKIEFYSKSLSEQWPAEPLPIYHEMKASKHTSLKEYRKYPLQFFSRHAEDKINSQFNEVASLRKHKKPQVQLNRNDANRRSIKSGDRVRIFNDRGEIQAIADVGENIKEGIASMTFGWNHSDKACINNLTESRITDFGYGTAFHDCLVDIELNSCRSALERK